MRPYCLIIILFLFFFPACTTQGKRIIFQPDPDAGRFTEQTDVTNYMIIESQNGTGDLDIPEWVFYCLDGDVYSLELQEQYNGKYLFVGEGRGENLRILMQWASLFSMEHELPRLITLRSERRLVNKIRLYPDDEYGDFYEAFIKKISNEVFSQGKIEQSFWIKKIIFISGEEDPDDPDEIQPDREYELFIYYILISTEKEILQGKIMQLINETRSKVSLTREQSASVNNIRDTFFEGF